MDVNRKCVCPVTDKLLIQDLYDLKRIFDGYLTGLNETRTEYTLEPK
jgi:hypothetical protein